MTDSPKASLPCFGVVGQSKLVIPLLALPFCALLSDWVFTLPADALHRHGTIRVGY